MQTIVDWLKHRFTKSRYASDDAVEQFTRIAQDQGLPLDYNHDKRLNELLSGNDDPAENLEEIAKLFGQPPTKKARQPQRADPALKKRAATLTYCGVHA